MAVIIACRAPKALRDRVSRLAEQARRTESDYLRLLLEDALREREQLAIK